MSTQKQNLYPSNPTFATGFHIAIAGSALILLWIGIFKFTPSEASGIKPLIENHPLLSWLLYFFTLQNVSDIIGSIEIVTATLLILSLKFSIIRKYAAILTIIIFATTLSFLITTPGIWKITDNIPITDFFILKDIVLLGFGIMLLKFPSSL